MTKKLLIFIVAYQAEAHIAALLSRIPHSLWESGDWETEVLLIDDGSNDATAARANAWMLEHGRLVTVLRNPVNQGYGGNQKLGYAYAIERGMDAVALLHGDEQYPPEHIPALIAPLCDGTSEAVFGSRMMHKKEALAGGMPVYKFLGNMFLTAFQNMLLQQNLSEYHSGFRAYSVSALKDIPFQYNSQDFAFDCEIIIQLRDTEKRIAEIPIPTRYAGEICRVNGMKYALQVIGNTVLSRFQRISCYYAPKFDYAGDASPYEDKTGFASSSHRFAIDAVPAGSKVLDIGCGAGFVARELRKKGCHVMGCDTVALPEQPENLDVYTQVDLEHLNLEKHPALQQADTILLLDVIEHLTDPEAFLIQLREQKNLQRLIITTGNIAFILMRISLLLGQFNYGKRGILDKTHKRLFTFRSLENALLIAGFRIIKTQGIPAPWPLVFGQNALGNTALKLNNLAVKIWRGLFAYQMAFVAEPLPSLPHLLHEAEKEGRKILAETLKNHVR